MKQTTNNFLVIDDGWFTGASDDKPQDIYVTKVCDHIIMATTMHGAGNNLRILISMREIEAIYNFARETEGIK